MSFVLYTSAILFLFVVKGERSSRRQIINAGAEDLSCNRQVDIA